MTDRCACRRPGGWYMHVDHCPRHGEVETILASGTYADRKGRVWTRVTWGGTPVENTMWTRFPYDTLVTPDQMRRKITREQHQEVCTGLLHCVDHPVPYVCRFGRWSAYDPDRVTLLAYDSFGAALEAARHMTGATP